jgi:hypothetical protein
MVLKIIKKIFPGVALGQDNEGNLFYVQNGDLFLNDSCEVEVGDKVATLQELNYDLNYIKDKYGDKDNLIHSWLLTQTKFSKPFDRIFQIENKWCFASYSCKKLVEIVFVNDLWRSTRISVSKNRITSVSRAAVFGINFKNAILKALKNGRSVTHLYWSDYKEWQHRGIFADFLIKITMTKDNVAEFNAWQAIGTEEALFFVHGILDKSFQNFTHIDFAYHYTNLEEIQKLLQYTKDKPILTSKKKILRIDGEITVDIAFELMRSFFPIDNLVDEYYTVTDII